MPLFFSLWLRLLGSSLFMVIAVGCSSWQVNQLANELDRTGPTQTLSRLETITPSASDRVQHLLNRGVLKFYTGDLSGAIEELQAAKTAMESLQAISVSENITAMTTNETLRSYSGTPSDQVLVHVILALAYLFNDELEGARVEMLQADVTMQRLSSQSDTSGQLASAHFIAGLIYEISREFDDALISYRKAYKLFQERAEPVPSALQIALLQLSQKQGLMEEFHNYVTTFERQASDDWQTSYSLILLYFDGVVSTKTETRLSVYAGKADAIVSVVIPRYPILTYRPQTLTLALGNTQQDTGILENIERRVREDLDRDAAKVLAAATVRAVSKYNMVKNAQQQGEIVGIFANIATVLSEQADVRSWNMLPSSLQVARLQVPKGEAAKILNLGTRLPPPTTNPYLVVWASDLVPHLMFYPVNATAFTQAGEAHVESNLP